MKISLTPESISVYGLRGEKFEAKRNEITGVSVLADQPASGVLESLRRYFTGKLSASKLRAIIVWADERAVTLDAYYDKGFKDAVDWFDKNGWAIASAADAAEKTPLVRVQVNRQ